MQATVQPARFFEPIEMHDKTLIRYIDNIPPDGDLHVVYEGCGVTVFRTFFWKSRKQSLYKCEVAFIAEHEDRELRLFTSGEITTADRFKIHAMEKEGKRKLIDAIKRIWHVVLK